MNPASTCPDLHELQRHALGALPDREAELERHLLDCPRCAETLQAMLLDDRLGNLMRRSAEVTPLPSGEAVEALIAQACRQTPTAADVTRLLAAPQEPDELGRLGGYRILAVVGAGGMGIVYRAEDLQLRRSVALKVMRPALAVCDIERQRFLREAQAMAGLTHESIVPIYQVGEDRGLPFLVMPLLQGESLEQRLEREGRVPAGEVLRLGREIAEGLAGAHERGLIHRDVKPANIWLEAVGEVANLPDSAGKLATCPTSRVKLLDFGLARQADDARLSRYGSIVGTPHYMAPEQVDGGELDARSDLFGLGCVLYRMTTGTLPFPGPGTLEVLRTLAGSQPRPPHEVVTTVPAALSDLIMQLLAKKPADRPTSASEVITALAAIERGEKPIASRPARPRAGRAWALLAVSALLVGLAFTLLSSRRERAATEPPERSEAQPPAPAVGASAEPLRRFVGHTDAIWSVALSPDGRLALSSSGLKAQGSRLEKGEDYSVRVWDVATGQQLRYFPNLQIPWAVAFDADGRHALAGGMRFGIRKWDLRDESAPARSDFELHRVLARAAFSPGGRWALSAGYGFNRFLRLWDVTNLTQVRAFQVLPPEPAVANCLAVSPDGRTAAVGFQPPNAWLWLVDLETGQVRELPTQGAIVFSVALSSDGRQLLSGTSTAEVLLWDVQAGSSRRIGKHSRGPVQGVAFCPDGHHALSGAPDRTLRLWNIAEGRERHRFAGHTGEVRAVAASADGRYALSGDGAGALLLWRMPDL